MTTLLVGAAHQSKQNSKTNQSIHAAARAEALRKTVRSKFTRALQKMMSACVTFRHSMARENEDVAREALRRRMSRPLALP